MSTGRDEPLSRPRRHPLVVLLAVLLFGECGLLALSTIYLITELFTATPDSYASAIALTLLAAVAAIWLALIAVNVLLGRAWVRGAAVTWQVLQLAVAIGCFQGLLARPDVGWLLLIPAVLVLVLLFTPPVVAATIRRA